MVERRKNPACLTRRAFVLLMTLCCLTGYAAGPSMAAVQEDPAPTVAERPQVSDAHADCQRIVDLLEQQKNLLSRETGQLKRELAAMREDLARPGLREILGGIGYIFGLAGVALYVQSRKEN